MSGPHISIPRPYGGSTQFGSTAPQRPRSELRMPRFFKRLFKFPQMDFEMAIWEMTYLLFAPRRVFKSIYYHKQTNNTWHRPDPSFAHLLSFFLVLTSLAWSLAYSPSPASILRLALMFVFVHFLAASVLYATIAYFLVGRFLTPADRVSDLPSTRPLRRRQYGLFEPAPPANSSTGRGRAVAPGETLEFGYSFDVAIRAFFPPYVLLYLIQFILMPFLARHNPISNFFANTLYLAALCYWTVIVFLGYNVLHFLHRTELLLTPLLGWVVLWLVALLSGWNMAEHVGGWMFWGVKKF